MPQNPEGDISTPLTPQPEYSLTLGNKQYELSNHLGNVQVTLSDKKLGQAPPESSSFMHYLADVRSAVDYYPFGMQMPGRSLSGGYRYGFNGKENDQETKTQDYGFRIYNPGIARFLSVDPLTNKFPMLTPYQFASNTPNWAVDLDGLEARVYTDLSAIPHSFISVIDDEGIINVYTFGQYGQNGNGLGSMYNTGSALVHLKGKDANNYITNEFENFPLSVYEISLNIIDKKKIIDYFSNEMKNYTIPAQKVSPHAPIYANDENGSKAVMYKPYFLTPDGCYTENCTSVANDGLKAGGLNVYVLAIPWLVNETLWEKSLTNINYKNVTEQEKERATKNQNSSFELPLIEVIATKP